MKHGAWVDRYDPAGFRLVRDGGRVVGGYYPVRAGQWFGGRCVPLVGIHAVVIAPEARGTGAGTELMRHAMRELHAEGAPLAVLYPATQPIYRRAGFEQAGEFVRIKVATAALPRGPRDLAVERVDPIDPAQRAAIAALAREVARADAGGLERDEFLWDRLLRPLGFTPELWRVVEGGRTTGFVSLQHTTRPYDGGLHTYVLHVRSLTCATPTAEARLLTLIADYDSLCATAVFDGAANAATMLRLAEYQPTVEVATRWMARLTDVGAALGARGYLPGLRGALDLEVADDLLPQGGRYRLTVEGSVGAVARGAGDGELAIDQRGLAALYTGYLSAEDLARVGLARGAPEVLARATALFAGRPPWLGEIF
jgi:predicted acetyltransferase